MPAVNQEAERIIKGMKRRSASRFRRLYGKRAKEVMYATANKLAQKEQVKMPPTYNEIFNENKSGDNSLRDWFGKSRSSDGKPGWVQLGGKYAGKPCAKQPGQTTKPKCGSSKMKRDLNKDEEEAAFRRKNAKDPNPDRKGKAINVKTEETINEKAPKYDKQGLDKFDRSKRLIRHMQDKYGPAKSGFGPDSKFRTGKDHSVANEKKAKMKEEVVAERADTWHPDPEQDRKLGGPGANQRAREDRASSSSSPKKADPKKLKKGESYMDYAKRQKKSSVKYSPELQKRIDAAKAKKKEGVFGKIKRKLGLKKEEVQMEGKKDACYKKVKSRYSVWPSAYASGALVKCRKKGAANWGNKSEGLTFQQFQEKCWQGYKKVGMKKKGDKLVPNCVPEQVTNEGAAWTKKSGQNKEGGLNEKGRKSYERENPGSDLKAPSKKVGNPRRASFCARMKGMRKRQKPSNNTGDDRLSKSLRAWNC